MRRIAMWVVFAAVAAGCADGEPVTADPSTSQALDGKDYTSTRYPIVLIHGLLGFKTLAGAVDYFNGIPEALEEGGARVFLVGASQASDSITRGNQLIPQLDQIRTLTGADRLNLIGHSQGAVDARYIAAVRPDLVASVTSIGGPHKGSNAAQGLLDFPLGLGVAGVQGLSDFFKLLSGSTNPNDARAALEALSPRGAAAFNLKYPAAVPTTECGDGAPVVAGISYYSWSGVGGMTNPVDLIDASWVLLGPLVLAESDGLVPRCSAHLGLVIRDDYLANHTDEINLLFGLISPVGVDPKSLYRAHANRIKLAGL